MIQMVFHEFEEHILIDQWNHEHIMDLNQMGNAILSMLSFSWLPSESTSLY
jgi:hypothetical protein